MKPIIFRKSILVLIFLTPLIADLGCKKQPKCGCGKDVVLNIVEGEATVYYIESSRTAYFYAAQSAGSIYYFCNPGKWIDSIVVYTGGKQGQTLILTGKAFYECNYLMNAGSYGYGYPPTYQVDVTALKPDYYKKK